MTPNQASKAYLKRPDRCPYCDGQIEGESVDITEDGQAAEQATYCTECRASFLTKFNLISVLVESGPE